MTSSRCRTWAFCDKALILGILTLFQASDLVMAQLEVEDQGPASGFQDSWDNQYRRGRSIVAEDFDGDGRVDFFVGNAGDESVVFRNLGPGSDGVVRFVPAQVLLQGELAFTASGSDYDNDSDLDLFIGCGGLEGSCLDFLFRNDSTPGLIRFTDVSLSAGIRGPAPAGVPLVHATGGGTWGDYDRDADQDLFVSIRDVAQGAISYKSVLWQNNGNGTFSDRTADSNLDYWASGGPGGMIDFGLFQHSSWIDVDNDGDLDLLLNNAYGPNVLWKNLLTEQGSPQFEEATQAFSPRGEDLRFPYFSFASAVADFNNDGWQDLILFNSFAFYGDPYGGGHGLFINDRGLGFFNASAAAGINIGGGLPEMAMGCQAADWNADGIPDLAIGSGDPSSGIANRLLVSTGIIGTTPVFSDESALIDYEPAHGIDPALSPFPEIPPYPYRTHGMVGADFDGDGNLDLGMVNGGTAQSADIVREPNRLFKFSGPDLGNTFRVRLAGDGLNDSRDGIGARAYVEVPSGQGTRRVFQTVLGASGFSAQNERTLTFGLGSDVTVSRLAILWQSGCVQFLDAPPEGFPSFLEVDQACWTCPVSPGPAGASVWLEPETHECDPCVSDVDCQDGIFCNGTESCDVATGQCLSGSPPSCDDGDPCTTDECDPGLDACTHQTPPPPGGVTNLRQDVVDAGSGSSSLTWDAEPLAGAYHVYRARIPDLDDLTCHGPGVPDTTTSCDEPVGPGELFFYLVSAVNCGGESTLGSDSAGRERTNLAPCP